MARVVAARDVVTWLCCGLVTGALVLGGAEFGRTFIDHHEDRGFVGSLARRDGQHYKHILENGYEYREDSPARVAFFPAYPMLAGGLAGVTGWHSEVALLVVSNVGLLAAFVLMGIYLRIRPLGRHQELTTPPGSRQAENYALLAMALLPTTFFFRLAYSEALFLCVSLAAMCAIARGWPLLTTAAIVGFATAVRPVGVALLLPLAWYAISTARNSRQAVLRLVGAGAIGCWGLGAYMAYQFWQFNEPFAFALTQENWRLRPKGPWQDKVVSLLAWEPIWSLYLPGTREHTVAMEAGGAPWFNLPLATPIYFVGTVALVAVGYWKRWLSLAELLLSIPLLAIPYLTRGFEFCMQSQGRFAAVVFPAYVVLGCLLSRLPAVVAVALLALSGALMTAYASLFASGHKLF